MDDKEHQRLKRKEDARKLKRPGYWACEYCASHNENVYRYCKICGALDWRITELTNRNHNKKR